MSKIRVLSPDISNKIAAGEVVERPASVVKELVENAVDAGATVITVEIDDGGIKYIRVTDDGSGMEAEDAKTAFLRHATSKVSTAESLEHICTLGFRGEALSSIAAVSHVEILTKMLGKTDGVSVTISAGEVSDEQSAGCPEGTTIIVRDLFFNTPARMKFLKTNKTEAGYISDILERLALSRPDISVKLISNEKVKLQTAGDGNLVNSIYSIYGKNYATNIKEVNHRENGVKVQGFTGLPTTGRANRQFQNLFVNGRYIKSPMLTAAVEEAYKNRMMTGRFPFYVLNIDISPSLVDVNVHPTKTEVKFSGDIKIYQIVFWAIKNALSQIEIINEITTEKSPISYDTQLKKSVFSFSAEKHTDTPQKISDKPIPMIQNLNETVIGLHDTLREDTVLKFESPAPVIMQFADTIFEQQYKIIGQVFNTYIIIECNNELVYIDQHAAHERQIYERLVTQDTIMSQVLLIPVSVVVSSVEYELINQNIDFLTKLGFELEEFGNNTYIIRQTPLDLNQDDIKNLLIEILENISIGKNSVTTEMQERALYTIACRAAIKANDTLSENEMKKLVDWVLMQIEVDTCPHGRPLTLAVTKRQIEKQFGRV